MCAPTIEEKPCIPEIPPGSMLVSKGVGPSCYTQRPWHRSSASPRPECHQHSKHPLQAPRQENSRGHLFHEEKIETIPCHPCFRNARVRTLSIFSKTHCGDFFTSHGRIQASFFDLLTAESKNFVKSFRTCHGNSSFSSISCAFDVTILPTHLQWFFLKNSCSSVNAKFKGHPFSRKFRQEFLYTLFYRAVFVKQKVGPPTGR